MGVVRSLRELGVRDVKGMRELCRVIEKMVKSFDMQVSMEPSHLVCAACEAHRRNVMGRGAVTRRAGM